MRVIRVFPDRIPPARLDLARAVRFGGEGVPGSERQGGDQDAEGAEQTRGQQPDAEEEGTRARVKTNKREDDEGEERPARCVVPPLLRSSIPKTISVKFDGKSFVCTVLNQIFPDVYVIVVALSDCTPCLLDAILWMRGH